MCSFVFSVVLLHFLVIYDVCCFLYIFFAVFLELPHRRSQYPGTVLSITSAEGPFRDSGNLGGGRAGLAVRHVTSFGARWRF